MSYVAREKLTTFESLFSSIVRVSAIDADKWNQLVAESIRGDNPDKKVYFELHPWSKSVEKFHYGVATDSTMSKWVATISTATGIRTVGEFDTNKDSGWLLDDLLHERNFTDFYRREADKGNLVVMHWRVWNEWISEYVTSHTTSMSCGGVVAVLKTDLEDLAESNQWELIYHTSKVDKAWSLKNILKPNDPIPRENEFFDLRRGYNYK